MRSITVTVGPLASASANNICLSQTPSSAFTLNGSTVSGGVATLDTPRRVLFTQAAGESGKTYAIVGTTWGGAAQSETLSASSGAGTVYTALDYLTITSIRISSAASGAITVGTNTIASSAWVRMSEYNAPTASIQCTVSGTVNYTVQETMQDPNSPTNPVAADDVVWNSISDTNLVAATATADGVTATLPVWIKVTLNSGSGSVSAVIAQSDVGGGGGGGSGGGGGGSTIVQGAVTTAAPTYVDGTDDDLSLTTKGGLRSTIIDGAGAEVDFTAPVAVTQSTSPWIVAGGGTAGTAASGVVTIQGVASMTPVQTQSALLSASDLTRAFDSGSTNAEASLVSATASQTTRVYALQVTSAGAGYIELRDGSGGTVLFRADFPAAGGWDFVINARPWAKTTANTALYWYRSAAVAMTIQAWYVKSA